MARIEITDEQLAADVDYYIGSAETYDETDPSMIAENVADMHGVPFSRVQYAWGQFGKVRVPEREEFDQ
jgi:hypothetical protein